MQPLEAILNPFTADPGTKKGTVPKSDESAPKAAALGPRPVKEKSQAAEIAELQTQMNKMAGIIMNLLPYFKQKIEEIDVKNKDLEKQLYQISSLINNHLSQITTINSSQMTTIHALLNQIQGDFQRINEQAQESNKLQRELQEQQSMLIKLTVKEGLKDGSIEIAQGGLER